MPAGFLPGIRQRLEEFRSTTSTVEVIEPSDEVRELTGLGRYLLDFLRTEAASDEGVRRSGPDRAFLVSLRITVGAKSRPPSAELSKLSCG